MKSQTTAKIKKGRAYREGLILKRSNGSYFMINIPSSIILSPREQ